LQVAKFCRAPLRHGNAGQAFRVVVVVVITVVVIKVLQRTPVYCDGQIQEQDDAMKIPPFKQESKPHLQIG
jgi:hypothetical protein